MAATSGAENGSALDELLDRATRMGNAPPFITQFSPRTIWLWRQWRGTVLEHTWKACILYMLLSVALCSFMELARCHGQTTWQLFEVPDSKDRWVARMAGLTTLWSYLLTMATFVNTFLLSQSFSFWMGTKSYVRQLQGRYNDLGMLVATHAQRDAKTGKFTTESRQALDDIARWIRLYNILFYASQLQPTACEGGLSFSVLCTEIGLKGLLTRGALTKGELDLILSNAQLQEKQRHNAPLQWAIARFADALKKGVFTGGVGLEERFLEEACKLRAICASIGDDQAARMPTATVHFVQVLIDTLLFTAPFALYPKLGLLLPVGIGWLTVFFRGFLELSKSFLDPFGNHGASLERLSITCLVCETNAGSVRWFDAIDDIPFWPTTHVK